MPGSPQGQPGSKPSVAAGRTASAADLTEAFDALPAHSRALVDIVFGQEMERILRELVDSGQVAKLTSRSKKT